MPLTKVMTLMLEDGPFSGSLFGTASFALTASYAENGGGTSLATGSTYEITSSWSNRAVSSSYALTASYSLNGGGGGTASLLTGQTFYVTTPSTAFSLSQVVVDEDQILVMLNGLTQSRTSSYTVASSTLTFTSTIPSGALVDVRFLNANNMAGPAVSSSYAATASYVINGVTASYVTTAETASFVTLAQTASYVVLAQTASYALNAVTASYSLTSSWSIQSQTASFVTLAQTASYVVLAQTASYVTLAQTASYIATASYALAALSASYAPNIYVLPSNVVSASAQLSNGGGTAFSNSNNLTVGQITASAISVTTLKVVTITSSIDYASGSNIFGTKSTDTQLFTGSVAITGSLTVNGAIIGTSSLASTASYFAGVSNGTTNYVTKFTGANTIGSSSIFDNGSVGIGTSSPSAKLDIGSAASAGALSGLIFSGLNSTSTKADYVKMFANVEFNVAAAEGGGYQLQVLQQGAYKNSIVASGITNNSTNYLALSTTNEAVRIISNGNVGIGTTTPGAKLSVEGGNIGIDGNNSAAQFFGAAGNVAGTNTTGGVLTVFGHAPNAFSDLTTPPYDGSNFVGAAGLIARGFSESAQYRGSLEFFTKTTSAANATSRMIITHDGNVGIGTTSPETTLDVQAANASFRVYGTGASDTPQFQLRNGSQIWQQIVDGADSNKWKLKTGGGTTVLNCDPSAFGLAVTGALSSTGNLSTISDLRITDSGGSKSILIGNQDSGGTNTPVILRGVNATLQIGTGTSWSASGGGTLTTIANFSSTGLAVTGTCDVSGFFRSNGETIGNSNSPLATAFADGNTGLSLRSSGDGTSVSFASFRRANATVIGSITRVTTTDAVAYNTTSDARLKENLRDFTDSGRLIDSLKPRVFDWKNSDENGKNVVGFVAQEQHAADPIFAHIGAVSVGDEDPDNITKQWQRSDSALIPILVAELKSLRARLAALEAK